ncbi:hypothetical protein CC80DRAFT_234696 [Byssothecium circinans]|uniref:Uncharacterized protein n=1 Tax=Byssothecium circinans TaxID=147558 RepID=A0A6A5U7Z5_9PLEO|nr:hypothetical protein CC80DRAFT_234696 [Byssothecium circinans]
MDGRFIIPVEPASGNSDVVVVEVQQEGSQPLDVRLVGCEGESPYVTHIKHRNLGKLRNKFKGSDDEWEQILSHFLLHRSPGNAKIISDVHLVYTLKNDTIELSFRQHVKGIKVTLGDISLPKDEEVELLPLDWSRISAQNHLRTLQELAMLKSSASSEHDTTSKLRAQLDDFIKTKGETEKEMLQQFMELLNEKKRKIRDQSRVLASAKVDETKGKTLGVGYLLLHGADSGVATAVKATRETTKPRKAAASRASKRKAASKAPEPEPEPASEAEPMEVDGANVEEQDESGSGAATPDRLSDEETEDEGGDIAASAQNTPGKTSESARSQSVAQLLRDAPEEAVTIPPRRELPFGRPATRSKTPAKQPTLPVADDNDDETEDEL